MPFTDDDLKRLKDGIKTGNFDWTEALLPQQMHALLARLEAAEVYRNEHPCVHVNCTYDDAWRKAAGKEATK